MDVNKYLVILKGEDRTKDIVKYNSNKGKVDILFKNSDKMYTYSKNDFKFYTNPISLDLQLYDIELTDRRIYNVEKVLQFEDYYKIFFKDSSTICKLINNVNITEKKNIVTGEGDDRLNYFKKIANIVSVRTEDGNALLAEEYQKINFIEKDSALYKYLYPNNLYNKTRYCTNPIIFPFRSNKSQYKAVKNALENSISVIEGPPGTGKTQTILNIISNIIMNGQTVAIVSNNNSATENVYEKLKDKGLDYICAVLGKKENKDNFINNQVSRYPEFSKLSYEEKYKLENNVNKLNNELNEIFDLQNDIAVAKTKLEEVRTQHRYFDNDIKLNITPEINRIRKVKSRNILKLKVELEDILSNHKKIDLLFKLKSIIIYKIGSFKFYKNNIEDILNVYDKLYYMVKENELVREINYKREKLSNLENNQLDRLSEDSFKLLSYNLSRKYSNNVERPIFESKDLFINSEEFTKEYPVIFSTTHSIKSCLNPKFKFDYIIMDESSQVDLITGVLALSCAKNVVIVGDLKQLPNVITTKDRNIIEDISKKYNIESSYNYLNHCFLSSMINALPNIPKTLLKEHYRCHPKIINFCNKKFYNEELIILTEDKSEKDVLKVYKTTKGNHARGHLNQRQVDVITNEVMIELEDKVKKDEIGIISPYRDQRNSLINNIKDSSVQVDTIHKFQGREQDAIIITTVDNEITEFVDDPKMLNVAVTRAKKYLRVVVSDNEKNNGTNIDDLVKYIQYNNFEIVQSRTKSVFDMLYKDYEVVRKEYLKGKKRISEFESENIAYNLIDEIISNDKYSNLKVVSHIPLNRVVNSLEDLSDDERKYANNINTHIDFIVYNDLNKHMVLAIEVDGYKYHKEGTKQYERDKKKDSILQKCEIPLIRLSTTGSNESKMLEDKFNEIFYKNFNNTLYEEY